MCRYVQVQQSYHLQRKIEILSAHRSTPCGRKVCNEISQNETYDSDRPSLGYNTTVFGHPPIRVQYDRVWSPAYPGTIRPCLVTRLTGYKLTRV